MKAFLFALGIFLVLAAPASAYLPPENSAPLLPDLRTKQSNGKTGLNYFWKKKKKYVGFETRTSNIGRGPFEIQADPLRRLDCDNDGKGGDYGVRQVIYQDLDGNRIFNRLVDAWTDWRDSGCIYNHPSHGHWHFDDLNTSFLLNSKGKVVSRVQKNSWCLMDMERATTSLPWITDPSPFYGNLDISVYENCSSPRVLQGLSPGWDDIYGTGTPGQFLNVTKVPSGNYCIVTVVDQKGVIEESRENNNRTGTPIRINHKKKLVNKRSGTC